MNTFASAAFDQDTLFIQLDVGTALFLGIPTLVALAAGITLGLLIDYVRAKGGPDGSYRDGWGAGITFGLVFAMFALLISNNILSVGARHNQMEWAKETYGLELSSDQIADLEFPSSPPAEDRGFGIAAVGVGKEIVNVRLFWEDDALVLLGTDGQPLRPLGTSEWR